MNQIYSSPAFLQPADITFSYSGMTLRDYFAAKVLATACADYSAHEAAELAYRYADAMLKAREA